MYPKTPEWPCETFQKSSPFSPPETCISFKYYLQIQNSFHYGLLGKMVCL